MLYCSIVLPLAFNHICTYSNVVVLSPKIGTFAARFIDSGAAVRVGDLEDLLREIRDVFCILCNTIMTCNIVVDFAPHPVPVVWILHEVQLYFSALQKFYALLFQPLFWRRTSFMQIYYYGIWLFISNTESSF